MRSDLLLPGSLPGLLRRGSPVAHPTFGEGVDRGDGRRALLHVCGASGWDRRDLVRYPSGVVSYALVPHNPMDGW